MKRLTAVAIVAATLAFAAPARGQAVQLPSQQIFSVGTTVMVPDRGGTYLGGVKRLSEGAPTRGVPILGQLPGIGRLFKNRGIGRETSNRGAHVNAYIIDLKEQEEALLSNASPAHRAAMLDPQAAREADFLQRNIARHRPVSTRRRFPPRALAQSKTPKRPATPSLAEIRRQNEVAQNKQNAEALKFFAQGQQAEADGKKPVAKIFYQMAARRARGTPLYDEVMARLNVVTPDKAKLVGR